MNIGFVGTGAMGGRIARNLKAAGHAVTAWDRDKASLAALAEAGIATADTPARAADCDVLFSMLPNDDAVRDVFIDGGLVEKLAKGLVHVNCATASVALAREMTELHAARGVGYVAAPVFGRPDAAATAELHILVGGADDAVNRVAPLLGVIGKKTWRIGTEPYKANLVKIAGNFMIASAIEAMSEATALGAAHGLDRGEMLDLYLEALFPSPVYRGYSNLIRHRKFEPAGFRLSLGLKDVRLALAAGEEVAVPMPVASILRDAFLHASAIGYDNKDWSSVSDISLIRSGQALP
jgi:3-hydroxyisobutyrate dehydrogenase-like beta-hydroxyacid dehydrogenase